MQLSEFAVSASSLCKVYQMGGDFVEVLRGVDFAVKMRDFTVITGPSGSGKTTLLNIIGGVDKPTSGKIFVFGECLSDKNEDFLS